MAEERNPTPAETEQAEKEHQLAAQEIAQSQEELKDIAVQTGLDVAGTLDPTPVCDIASAGYAVSKGDYVGAGLTMLGVIPYLGDLVGKSAKGALLARRVAKIKDRIDAALKRLKAADALIAKAGATGAKQTIQAKLMTATGKGLSKVGQVEKSHLSRSLKRELPLLRNPRQLAKHHGPISEKELVEELTSKGFHKVKTGTHQAQGVLEDSDVYLRKVVDADSGKEYFECVRFDRRLPNSELNRGALRGKTPGELQAADKKQRQVHMTMKEPEVPVQ